MKLQDSTLTFRVPQEIKARFEETVKHNNLTLSFVLRTLMQQYVRTNGKDFAYDR